MHRLLFVVVISVLVSSCGVAVKSVQIPTPIGPLGIEFQENKASNIDYSDKSPQNKEVRNYGTYDSNSEVKSIISNSSKAPEGWEDVTELIGMNWTKLGGKVTIKDGIIVLKDTEGYDYTGIKSPKILEPGTYKLSAEVKAINVQTTMSSGKGWELGKFQGYVEEISTGTKLGHNDNHITGTFDWSPWSTQTRVASKKYEGYFRIGFQQATGTIMVKNIRIYKQRV